MRTLTALFVATLLAAVNGQGCNVDNGSPVFINSTADFTLYGGCGSLPGIIIGNGNLTGSISFSSLTEIRRTIGDPSTSISQTGIQILGSQLTGVSFPQLTTFYGSFIRVIGNNALTSLSVGPSSGFTNTFTAGGTQIVIQSNPVLVSPTITINSLGNTARSIVTIGADNAPPTDGTTAVDATGATGTVSLPQLTTALSLTIFSNGVSGNSKSLAISLPAITALTNGINAVGNNYLTSLTVGSNGAYSISNGGIALVQNPNLATVNLGTVTSATGAINIVSNGAASLPLTLQFDNLVLPRGVQSSITVNDNAGLTSVSFAKVQYVGIAVNILRNGALTSINLPGPFVTGSVQMDSNGINTQNGVNAIIGVQNASTGGVSFTGNKFASIAFPQAFFWRTATFSTNTIIGPFYANTTFYTLGAFSFTGAGNAGNTAMTVLDLSGLASANSLTITGQTGTSGASILLGQLQQILSSDGISITGNSGFSSLTFGKLVSVLQITLNNNNMLNTIDFGSTATNNWSTRTITIDSSTTPGLSSINFGGLVQANSITVSLSSASTTASTISANKLTCFNQLIVNSQNSMLNAVNLQTLAAYNAINVQGGSNNCAVTVGSATTNCANGCFTCPQYNTSTSGSFQCGGNTKATTISGPCAANSDARLDTGKCTAASPYSFTTTSATLLAPPTPTSSGGSGSTSTVSTVTNTLPTSSVTNSATTTTNNNQPPRTTGSGVLVSSSLLVLASAVALVL